MILVPNGSSVRTRVEVMSKNRKNKAIKKEMTKEIAVVKKNH